MSAGMNQFVLAVGILSNLQGRTAYYIEPAGQLNSNRRRNHFTIPIPIAIPCHLRPFLNPQISILSILSILPILPIPPILPVLQILLTLPNFPSSDPNPEQYLVMRILDPHYKLKQLTNGPVIPQLPSRNE
jgi:hypothetical protein